MALSNLVVKQRYNANGATVTFAIPSDYTDEDELVVKTRDESTTPATEATKTNPTHYTVVGSNIVFGVAPANGLKVLVSRATPLQQTVNMDSSEAFPAEDVEEQMDRLEQQIQELNEKISRALLFQETSTAANIPLPDPVAGEFLKWGPSGLSVVGSEAVSNTLAGRVTLADGDLSKDIVFSDTLTSPVIIPCLMNIVDGSIDFQPLTISELSSTGATVSWNAAIVGSNYVLNWIAVGAN